MSSEKQYMLKNVISNEEKALDLFPDVENMMCMCIGVREKLIEMAEWKDEGFLEWLKVIDTCTLHDKSRYIKLAIEKLEKKKGNKDD